MNFFLNHALISLNTAPIPKNIFLMIIKKHILMIWNVLYKSPSNSHSVQILRQQNRWGWGSRLVLIMLTQGGVSQIRKDLLTWYFNTRMFWGVSVLVGWTWKDQKFQTPSRSCKYFHFKGFRKQARSNIFFWKSIKRGNLFILFKKSCLVVISLYQNLILPHKNAFYALTKL